MRGADDDDRRLPPSPRPSPAYGGRGGVPFPAYLLLLVFCLLPAPAAAQMSGEDRRRERVESVDELRRTEDGLGASRRRGWLLDIGSTISTTYTTSDDNDRQDTVADAEDHAWVYDGRVYALVQNAPRTSKFYFRSAARYTETKKNSPAIRGSDFIQPKIEMLYWERAFSAHFRHRLRLGRHFVSVGRGLAFGLTADGLSWQADRGRWSLRAMALRQNPGDDNLDFLAPGPGRTKRQFYGFETRYQIRRGQSFGAYLLFNLDHNFDFAVNGQRHQLDSRYYGFTMEASPLSRLSIWGEFVLERGLTYGHLGTTQRIGVYATAYDLGMQFFVGGTDLAPSIFAEVAGASGDRDRIGNVFSSSGGSTAGRDTVFRGFGGLNLGVALAPALANLHAFKSGFSVRPFARSSHMALNDCTLQLTYYYFLAEDEAGPTSDPVYNVSPGGLGDNIGHEYDAQLSWKPLADLRYLLQLGMFVPGPAYGLNRSHEEFLRFKMSVDL